MAITEAPPELDEDVAETVKLVTSAVILPVCGLGIILSALSVATYRRIPLRNASSTFLTALAFADFVFLLLGLLRIVIYLTQDTNQLAGRRIRYYSLMVVIFVLVSFRKFIVCIRCAISAERMIAVVFPLKSRHFRMCRHPKLFVLTVLVLTLLSNFPIVLMVDSERDLTKHLPTTTLSLNKSVSASRCGTDEKLAVVEQDVDVWNEDRMARPARFSSGWKNLPVSGQPDRGNIRSVDCQSSASKLMHESSLLSSTDTEQFGATVSRQAGSGNGSLDAEVGSGTFNLTLYQVFTMVAEISFMHVPFVCTVVFTLVIALAIRGSKEVRRTLKDCNTASLTHRRSQVTRMILFSTSAFIVLTLPMTLTMFLSSILPEFLVTGRQRNLYLVVSRISFACDVVDSTINFWFYFTMSKTFRMTFKMVIGKMTFVRFIAARRNYPLLYGSETSSV